MVEKRGGTKEKITRVKRVEGVNTGEEETRGVRRGRHN